MGSPFLGSAVDAYRAESERTVALAEARLKWIEGNKASEEVIGKHLTNVLREASISDYRVSLYSYRRKEAEKQREANRLKYAVEGLNLYVKGDLATGLERQRIWPGYRVLQPHIPLYVYADWFVSTFSPLEPHNFIGRSVGGTMHPIPVAAICSIGECIEYQNRHYQYIVAATGLKAYLLTLQAFAQLADVWSAQAKEYADDLAAIRAGHYDLWKPGDFVRLGV